MNGTELWLALIGVGGTLLGTFVGWLLSKPKNKKINIILNNPILLFPYIERRAEKDQLIRLELYMELVFYNPADNMKLMRNIRVAFHATKRKKLFTLMVSNLENTTTFAGNIKFPRCIDAINIPPHEGELFKCQIDFYEKELEMKDSIVKAFLVFDNEKNKPVSQPIDLPNLKNI